MDSVEQDGSFSSPSVNLTLQKIITKGTSGRVLSCTISDGSFFLIRESFRNDEGIMEGLKIDSELFDRLKTENSYLECLNKAIDLCSMRENSTGGLYLKLIKKGFCSENSRLVIEELVKKRYLNDRRFADLWLKKRLRSNPEGRILLIRNLLDRGVPHEIAEEAVQDIWNEDTAIKALTDAGKKLFRKNSDSMILCKKLVRKGFSLQIVKRYLNETFKENSH